MPRRSARQSTLADYLKAHFKRAPGRRLLSRCSPISSATSTHRDALQDIRRADPRPQAGRDLPRLRPALPAFDRAGLQGRAEQRRVPADHLRRRRRISQVPGQKYTFGVVKAARRAAISRCWPSAAGARLRVHLGAACRGRPDDAQGRDPRGARMSETRTGERRMQLGMIGLGRMGGNIVRRLMRNGHDCVVFDQNPAAIKALAGEGATGGSRSQPTLVSKLEKPRAVWVMLPAGEITEDTVEQLGDAARARRHHHRRRQRLLQGRHPAREGAARPRASTTSIAAPAAASGASSAAIA